MNIRYFSLLALLVVPATMSLAMEKPADNNKPIAAKDAQAVPDLKTTLAALSKALEMGNEDAIAQCAINVSYHTNTATPLLPLIKQILEGKTKLSDRATSWALASFAFAFVGTPNYDLICAAIARFHNASDQQPPEIKHSGKSLEERINLAVETRNTMDLFALLDECKTNDQREIINSALSLI